MAGKSTSGNRTERRGSRYIQNPHLDRETAQEVKILMLAEGLAYTPETVDAWFRARVHRDYLAYEAKISQEAEAEAWSGQI